MKTALVVWRSERALRGRGVSVFGCLLGLAMMLSCNDGLAEARPLAQNNKSAVYCLHNRSGLKIFAERVLPDGNLAFGISIWSKAKNNIGVFGIASRRGDYWEYTDHMNSQLATGRCRITINLHTNKAPHFEADPTANCQGRGGFGTEIGTVQFPRNAYEGPVTYELNDPDTFFGKAGKC